jgi:hypothetical protein
MDWEIMATRGCAAGREFVVSKSLWEGLAVNLRHSRENLSIEADGVQCFLL